MFGNLGQLAGLLKNAGQIKQNMQAMQERLADARFTGESGGGQVTAIVDGKCDMVSIKLDPAAIQAGDIELLEELICAAVRDATVKAREAAQQEMSNAMGGMDIGGMMDMFGKQG